MKSNKNSLFVLIFQGQIWGNLISYLVLRPTAKPTVNNEVPTNGLTQRIFLKNLTNITNNEHQQCGAHFSEKDFHITDHNVVPKKLVGIDFLKNINNSIRFIVQGFYFMLYLYWSCNCKYYSC
jgi:hypothetical protein